MGSFIIGLFFAEVVTFPILMGLFSTQIRKYAIKLLTRDYVCSFLRSTL